MTALDNIRIVLVNTTHPGNIGAAARAMKNMGLHDLYLVAPKQFPHEKAVYRAANALDVLDRAVVVDSFEAAVADCGLVVGSSARQRAIPWPLLDAREAGLQAVGEAARHKVAIVFGREDRGLTNEELQRCQLHVTIPANPEYGVLNMAMAVQVIAYELHMAASAGTAATDVMAGWDMPFAGAAEVEHFFAHLEETLSEMGFLRADAPKQTAARLRRLFQRTRLDTMEINMLRGILKSSQYWVRRARGDNS